MREGVRLGIDVGSVRVGVAQSDPGGILATPVTTIGPEDIAAIAELVTSGNVVEVLVGLPRGLDGGEGPAAARARQYAADISGSIAPVPVRLIDERLTTVDAHRGLRESGVAGRRQRRVVDMAAACLILQTALDLERATGRPPGESVTRRKPRTKGSK